MKLLIICLVSSELRELAKLMKEQSPPGSAGSLSPLLPAVPPGHFAGSPWVRHGPAATAASSAAAAGRGPAPGAAPGAIPGAIPGPSMAFPRPRPARPELPRQRVQTLQCGQGAVRAARFNADGNYCLTCGSDKTLKLWNPHKGTALRAYQGHGYEVLDAAGSFDNSQICSGSADKAVALWDVTTGQVVRKYRGHAGKVNCVQFNEEATVIVSGEGVVWGHPVSPGTSLHPLFPPCSPFCSP
ncbi:WD repeat domain-containing protein 83-like [Poecile atricapillus]|uniref:WD repeat domain-containing protein 83-like n=1 Tax=Poecile atricapillus TaxID=48891 RepID=UPI0027386DFB|nr:WD repeat domain-containing protein 83-like [Poecile atricapillus]